MKKVIIGFSRPRSFFSPFSWAIRIVEGTPYSHVYIRSMSERLGVDLIYQASWSQVNFMGLQNFKKRALVVDEFEFEITDDSYNSFMRWAIINSGSDYSMKQPLGILLIKLFNLKKNPLGNGRSAWVCSELAGFVLKKFLGVSVSDSEIETMGPKRIYEICMAYGKPIFIGG